MNYELKDSRLLYRSKYLELYEDLVRIKNNNTEKEKKKEKEIGEHKNEKVGKQSTIDNNLAIFQRINVTHDSVMVVPIFSDGSLLMISLYRYLIGQMLLEFPGGTIEETEYSENELRETAKKELLEETGYSCKLLQYKGWFYAWPAKMNEKTHVFLAKGLEKVSEQKLEKTEDIKVKIVPSNAIMDKFFKRKLKSAKSITAFIYAYMQNIM